MKKSILIATLSAPVVASISPLFAQSESKRPNIVFLFSDDHSYNCVSSTSQDKIYTPSLDKLLREGTSFTHTFNQGAWNGAVSAASRGMLATGVNVWKAQDKLNDKEHKMWSERMKEAGYDTYFSGKWHVAGVNTTDVFDTVKNIRGGMPNQSDDCYNRTLVEGVVDKWTSYDTSYGGHFKGGKHWAEVVKDDAIEYINMAKQSDNPFFMYLAFNSPHDPRQAPKSFFDMYSTEDIAVPESFLDKYPYANEIGCSKGLRDERLAPWPRTEYSIKVNRHEYYAMITHLDEQIGLIVEELERSGKMDNTYIIYTADHGLAIGDHGFLGKQNMYDASMRVPFIVVGPNVAKGKEIDDMIYLQDVMATALDWAGCDNSTQQVDFISFRPQLEGDKKSIVRRDAVYGAYTKLQRSVRDEQYQLIIYPGADAIRLYDLKKDPNAINDLSGDKKYIKKMQSLYARFTELQKEMNDDLDCSQTFNNAIGKLN